MEGKNRYVNTNFWNDPYVLEHLDPTEKLIYLWLMTNDKQNVAGAFELSIKKASFETGYEKDIIIRALKRFEHDDKLQYIFDYIILFNTIKHQKPNPKILQGMKAILNNLPENLKNTIGFDRLLKALINININTNNNDNNNNKTFDRLSIEFQLANLLYNLIKQRNQKFKEPDLDSWTKEIDLMIRIDKRSKGEIEKIIRWCQQDDFWQNNILSTSKLRKQYDQLYLKMNGQKKNGFKKIAESDWNTFYQMNVGKESFRTQAEFTNSYCMVLIDGLKYYVKKTDKEKFNLQLAKG